MIINLISSPRNVSTALMYSFAQRTDMTVLDEPFYGNYLTRVETDHPGKQEIIANMEINIDAIVERIHELSLGSNVFVKNMAHHLFDMEELFMKEYHNVFFIRDPARIIASFSKVIDSPVLRDIGIKQQLELFSSLKESCHITPIVIDSEDLIADPHGFLRTLCEKLSIDFDRNMLSWKTGGIPEDGIWAKYWYNNVHNSTGFKTEQTDPVVPKHLKNLHSEAMHYYLKLKKYALKF